MSEHSSKDVVAQLADASRKLAEARDIVHEALSRNLINGVEGTLLSSGIKTTESDALAGELFRHGYAARDAVADTLTAVAGAMQTIEECVRRINKATQSSGAVTFRSPR